ncbi:MAG: hypothetical protein JO322_15760 [Candidatus Eremiobacteraeota bacterium]|nr:hypothetical protein [Candidatus Eremiobacteraeota bacterium]
MRLFIGIPTSGSPAKPFVESLATLEIPASFSSVDRTIVTGNFVPAQRELIVRRALARGADRLLMCDDDMVLPKDALAKLSAVLDEDSSCALAGALYYSRDGFRPMIVGNWNAADTTSATIPAFGDEPVAVDGVGFGCVLLRLDALRAMEAPYFSAQVYIEPNASRVRVCNEDYLFCARLRAGNLHVILHPGVRCGHFDRATGTVHPEAWEDSRVTSEPRMAVLKDGSIQLVPLAAAQSGDERHELAAISYVWPGV